MRVIAGSARRLPLKTIEGLNTRPTSDKIKETLFNILNPDIYNSSFLDLFSGSGAIGIEALSRGAQNAVFVENNRKAVNCIKDNLEFTKLSKNARVVPYDCIGAVKLFKSEGLIFDIIFMDPPYNKSLEEQIIKLPELIDILSEDGIVVIEASIETDFSYIEELPLRIYKEKLYKNNKHIFICRK